MFCSGCGNQISDQVRFCSSCGRKVDQQILAQPVTEDFSKSAQEDSSSSELRTSFTSKLGKTKTRNQIALLIAFILLIGIIGYKVFGGNNVDFSLSVTAPYGGVFENEKSCVPVENYSYLISGTSLVLRNSQNYQEEISLAPTWVNAGNNSCTAKLNVKISGDTVWELYLAEEKIGEISNILASDGLIDIQTEIEVSHSVHGAIVVSQKAMSCERRNVSGWYCSWFEPFYLNLNSDNGNCNGTGYLNDLNVGIRVTVFDNKGALVASGRVDDSNYDLRSFGSKMIDCTLSWRIEGVPHNEGGYSIKFGDRPKIYYSLSELQKRGWGVEKHFGD